MPAGGGGRGGGGETPSFNFTGATFYRAHTRGKPKDTEGAANRQDGIFYTKTLFAVQYQYVNGWDRYKKKYVSLIFFLPTVLLQRINESCVEPGHLQQC